MVAPIIAKVLPSRSATETLRPHTLREYLVVPSNILNCFDALPLSEQPELAGCYFLIT